MPSRICALFLVVLAALFLACGGGTPSGAPLPAPNSGRQSPAPPASPPTPSPVATERESAVTTEKERAEEERLAAEAKARAEEEAERLEEEMARFEVAALEYHSDNKLRLARGLVQDAKVEKLGGNFRAAERLEDRARERYADIVKDFPGTQAAADAQSLLDGKPPPDRPRPPLPVLPKEVVKTDPHPLLGQHEPTKEKAPAGKTEPATPKTENAKANPAPAPPYPSPAPRVVLPPSSNSGKTVFVRGYTRKDGTHVQAHFRSPPGSKR
jgi:hypothetical protein